MKWKDLPPEEKERRKARHREIKRRRKEYEEEKQARERAKAYADKWGRNANPGDWLRYHRDDEYGLLALRGGKVVRFKEWNDDGHNHKRAPRNKKIVVEIEPHLYAEPKILRCCKLGEFFPLNAMEVLAEAAR